MSTIEEDIVEWCQSRPSWLRVLMRHVAAGEAVDDAFIRATADAMIAGTLADPPKLEVADLPTVSSGPARVQLRGIGELENVNALLSNESLSFGATGLTLIYGDNASGKSGYARLVKEVAEARHKERVRPNAFKPEAARAPQRALISYSVDDENLELGWPNLTDPRTRSIHFYDEACGDQYLRTDSELTFQPSGLKLFTPLIAATDQLRAQLDRDLQSIHLDNLPALAFDTAAGAFLAGANRRTTEEAIRLACQLPSDAEQRRASLTQEIARMNATDPARERQRLNDLSQAIKTLAKHFEVLGARLGGLVDEDLKHRIAEAERTRAAADLASKINFADEPLDGVGTETWRRLWSAAEAYSSAHAYADSSFPETAEGSRCVLCQQEVSPEAAGRLSKFHAFVHDKTESDAAKAEGSLSSARQLILATIVSSIATASALTTLRAENPELAERLDAALGIADQRRTGLLALADQGDTQGLVSLSEIDILGLHSLSTKFSVRAGTIDDSEFKRVHQELMKERRELEALFDLSKMQDALIKRVGQLRRRHRLEALRDGVTTQAITAKVTELTRVHVTSLVSDRFTRETEKLGLQGVFFGHLGGNKGKVKHKPQLLGVVSGNAPHEVLSEGEQTALGLAGLFTEVHFDESKSAVVLDDPVSSLTHAKRRIVARRVVELAEERQVIVFTHDLTFLGYLLGAAEAKKIPISERCIERTGGGIPGRALEGYPWKAKDPKKRFGDLLTELARIDRDKDSWNQDEYLRATSDWAGDLSETYERIIRSYVANPLVDRATTEVAPRMFRMIAKITNDDNEDFQAGYGTVSEWAKRHDKSEEVNFVAPTVEQMRDELNRAKEWFERIKGYHN